MKLTNETKKLFEQVTQIYAISGQENLLANFLIAEYTKLGFELVFDNLGSVFRP